MLRKRLKVLLLKNWRKMSGTTWTQQITMTSLLLNSCLTNRIWKMANPASGPWCSLDSSFPSMWWQVSPSSWVVSQSVTLRITGYKMALEKGFWHRSACTVPSLMRSDLYGLGCWTTTATKWCMVPYWSFKSFRGFASYSLQKLNGSTLSFTAWFCSAKEVISLWYQTSSSRSSEHKPPNSTALLSPTQALLRYFLSASSLDSWDPTPTFTSSWLALPSA